MRVSLRNSLFILPNLFTLGSVFCGFYAIVLLTRHFVDRFYQASMLIVLAMFLDAIDGRVARMTRTQSAIGVQLDSLADVVSFGVAPALLVYRWSLENLNLIGLLASFSFVAAGVIRLARFNVLSTSADGVPKKPSKYIMGLPIPGAAGILVSLAIAYHITAMTVRHLDLWLLFVVIALAALMVSRVPFRSFKEFKLSWSTVALISTAVVTSAILTLRFHISLALAWLLVSYVVVGVIETFLRAASDRAQRLERRRNAPKEN